MSQLWACYIADNVERFRRLLALTGHSAQAAAVWNANVAAGGSSGFGSGGSGHGDIGGSPYATSPRASASKLRKSSGHGTGAGAGNSKPGASGTIGKNEINSRDHAGLTILLRASASTNESALAFVRALLEHPAIDIYVQDPESGWNALHRALYAGNISIARLLLDKERKDIAGQTLGAPIGRTGKLIKTKDHEGNSPFDLYNSTIHQRSLDVLADVYEPESDDSGDDEVIVQQNQPIRTAGLQALVDGEDLFFFGSNKNLTLGMGDGDDRQFPERVYLNRPDHLIERFFDEYNKKNLQPDEDSPMPSDVANIPTWIRARPLLIHDVVLSKLHSAVLTDDPVSNLYMCGIGRGGRLGLGDENTRFSFESVGGPLADKKIVKVALGQNHSMAITNNGQLWTWGSNSFSQLGYTLPPSPKLDEDPMTSTPRQVFGPLRKEYILGVAASALHSVAHTGSSLYSWGKNVGQLALMDADSRSLDIQTVPRKVAASLFSAPIVAVSAIDKATTCLLANHTVCVFTNYGYNIVKFNFADTFDHHGRFGNFSMSSRYDAGRNHINYIASGGNTIAAVTSRGDLFTMNLTNLADANQSTTSTTNPSKIRDSLTTPQCIWSARKDGVRSVDVGEQGSVIISTHSGAVWRRIKRVKAKDAHVSGGFRADAKKKDYKFQRVPYISNVATVRSSAFGAFAAVRCDSNVIKEQVGVDGPWMWDDILPLMPLFGFQASKPASKDADILRHWNSELLEATLGSEVCHILRSTELEDDLKRHLTDWSYKNRGSPPPGVVLCTSLLPEIRIPVHSWIASARSSVLRDALSQCRHGDGTFELPGVFSIKTEEADGGRNAVITFSGIDLLTLVNFVIFMYEDKVVPVWNYTRQAPALANRYRQVRTEVMKFATRIGLTQLEAAARVQTGVKKTMDKDFLLAIKDERFFEDADAILELKGAEIPVHSTYLCKRCPWFEGLFNGRSRGQWLAGRREAQGASSDKVRLDLKHMDPEAFHYVLQHLYAELSSGLFRSLVVADLEALLDIVFDVLAIANELMLDTLSQVCQIEIGQYTTTRNVAQLLNIVSPCSVSEFKDAGLEYICVQMETMLENHLLDDLDEDIFQELDAVVRAKQLSQMPVVKSGRADLELHEKYPELAQDIDEERQRRVREMAFKTARRDDDRRTASSSYKGRVGSVDDHSGTVAASPSAGRSKRKARNGRNEPPSPVLRAKASQADLIFSMEDDEAGGLTDSPLAGGTRPVSSGSSAAGGAAARDASDDVMAANSAQDESAISVSQSLAQHRVNLVVSSPVADVGLPTPPARPPAVRGLVRLGSAKSSSSAVPDYSPSTPKADNSSNPWGCPAPSSASKLDLRSIMTESSSSPPFVNEISALSAGLNAQRGGVGGKGSGDVEPLTGASPKIGAPKMSQKERKKQQQQQQQQQTQKSAKNEPKMPVWDTSQTPGEGKRPSLSWQASQSPSTHLAPPPPTSSSPLMPDAQIAAAQKKKPHYNPRAASPDTRFAGQPRPSANTSAGASAGASTSASTAPPVPLIPHSKVYIKPAPKAEPILGLTMADIFLQQQLEQESRKEAVAKRSLQEIQEEQAFQEWWDQESRRAQEEEARRQNPRDKAREGRGRGGGGGGGRGGGKAGASSGAGAASSGPRDTGEAKGSSTRKNKHAPGHQAADRGGEGHGSAKSGSSRSHRGGRGGVAAQVGEASGNGHQDSQPSPSSQRRGRGGGSRGGRA